MKATIEAMRNKEMGSYKTSRIFTLPQTTLQGYVKDWQERSSETIKQNWVGRKLFFVRQKMICLIVWWKDGFLAWQWQTSCVSLTNLL